MAKIKTELRPWDKGKKGLSITEARNYILNVWGLRVSQATLTSWIRNGIETKDGATVFLRGNKAPGVKEKRWVISPEDIDAFFGYFS